MANSETGMSTGRQRVGAFFTQGRSHSRNIKLEIVMNCWGHIRTTVRVNIPGGCTHRRFLPSCKLLQTPNPALLGKMGGNLEKRSPSAVVEAPGSFTEQKASSSEGTGIISSVLGGKEKHPDSASLCDLREKPSLHLQEEERQGHRLRTPEDTCRRQTGGNEVGSKKPYPLSPPPPSHPQTQDHCAIQRPKNTIPPPCPTPPC